jgi:hypothetical protein
MSSKLPIHRFLVTIARPFPYISLKPERIKIPDSSSSQTLSGKSTQFNFRDIEPAPVFESMVESNRFIKAVASSGANFLNKAPIV